MIMEMHLIHIHDGWSVSSFHYSCQAKHIEPFGDFKLGLYVLSGRRDESYIENEE